MSEQYQTLASKYGFTLKEINAGEFSFLEFTDKENNSYVVSYFTAEPATIEDVDKRIKSSDSCLNFNIQINADTTELS